VQIGDVYHDRYTVEKKLGWGHFSTVWLASDNTKQPGDEHYLVALKIQKSASQYTEAAKDEIELLTQIANADPGGNHFVVQLLHFFSIYGPHGKHMCLVFETMGRNLLSLIKQHNYQGIPLESVKIITRQCLIGLDYMHTRCNIIHTDIKPENFLLSPETPFVIEELQANRRAIVNERKRKEAEKKQAMLDRQNAGTSVEEIQRQLAQPGLNKNQKKRLKMRLKKQLEKEAKAQAKAKEEAENKTTAAPATEKAAEPTTQAESPLQEGETKEARAASDGAVVEVKATTEDISTTSEATSAVTAPVPEAASTPVIVESVSVTPAAAKATHVEKKTVDGKAVEQTGEQEVTEQKIEKTSVPAEAKVEIKNEVKSSPEEEKTGTSTATKEAENEKKQTSKSNGVKGKISRSKSNDIPQRALLVSKLADLGNACWTNKHFTNDVTTRQYRSPEVIVGYRYDTKIDIWSVACLVFELITGEFLFDPREDKGHHSRDEDHLALMIELLGQMPKILYSNGEYSRDFFLRKGQLRNIKHLECWGLQQVLHEKYKLPLAEAKEITSFLTPMLALDPRQRVTAATALEHSWLESVRHLADDPVGNGTVAPTSQPPTSQPPSNSSTSPSTLSSSATPSLVCPAAPAPVPSLSPLPTDDSPANSTTNISTAVADSASPIVSEPSVVPIDTNVQ
jgi:serine/threonine protein kinase